MLLRIKLKLPDIKFRFNMLKGFRQKLFFYFLNVLWLIIFIVILCNTYAKIFEQSPQTFVEYVLLTVMFERVNARSLLLNFSFYPFHIPQMHI